MLLEGRSRNINARRRKPDCINIRRSARQHLKTINFPFGTNGKFMVLGVPKLKHFSVQVILWRDAFVVL